MVQGFESATICLRSIGGTNAPPSFGQIKNDLIFKNGPNPAPFCFIFVLIHNSKTNYSTNLTINDKSLDGVLGTRTWCGSMEGANKSTQLWQHPKNVLFLSSTILIF